MKKLRITHTHRHGAAQYTIRFSGDNDPFWEMRDRLVDLGADEARWDPRYHWDDGKQGAWWIDQDTLLDLQDYFYNLQDMIAKADRVWEEKDDLPDWDDMPFEEESQEKQKKEERQAEEQARRQKEEAERREQERRRKEEQARMQTPMPRTLQEAFSALELPMSAGRDEVKRAYRKLALVHHPDKHTQAPETVRAQQESLFKRINSANMIILKWLEACRR